MQFFRFASLAATETPPGAGSFCAEGVINARLDAAMMKEGTMSLRSLWERIAEGWNDVASLPEIISMSLPTVYEMPGEGYRYSKLVCTEVDEVIQVSCASPRRYRLRAYIEHRHHGIPARTSMLCH